MLGVAILVGGLALWLTLDNRFYIYGARVIGQNGRMRRLSPEEVFEASGLMGLHILWARSARIETRILDRLPALERVEVACRLPANCTIMVTERQPKILWDEGETLWWIDEEGVIFSAAPVAPEELSERQIVRGTLPLSGDEGDRLDESVRVALTELWKSGLEIPTELRYTSERGLMFTNERGWLVVVGQGPGMAERLEMLDRLTAYLTSRGVTPRFLDVRFLEAPYYSLTNDS